MLFGASGVGKSTALRLIAGLERPTRGHVRLGEDLLFDSARGIDRPLRARRVGLIFQDDLPVPPPGRARQRPLRPERPGPGRGGPPGRGGRGALRGRPPAGPVAGDALRRRAPARRPGEGAGPEAEIAPLRRADLRARPLGPRRPDRPPQGRPAGAPRPIPVLYVTHSPAEAIALGSRLFLLAAGRLVDEGPPLDVLARSAGVVLSGVENRFAATVERVDDGAGESVLRLDDGPSAGRPPARLPGRSARLRAGPGRRHPPRPRAGRGPEPRGNVLAGTVVRDRRARGRGGRSSWRRAGAAWIVSVVAPAVESALGLCPGVDVTMIVKARSCHVAKDSDREIPEERTQRGTEIRRIV